MKKLKSSTYIGDLEIDEIREVYSHVKSIQRTAEIVGRCKNTVNKYVKDLSSKNPHSREGKGAVVMCDTEGNILKYFKNSFQASKTTGIRQSSISLCLNRKIKSAGGYVFRFQQEI